MIIWLTIKPRLFLCVVFALIQTKCRKSVSFVSVHNNNNNNNRLTYPCVHNSVVFIFSFRFVSFCVVAVAVVSKVPVVLSSKSEYFNMFVHVCRKVYVCFVYKAEKKRLSKGVFIFIYKHSNYNNNSNNYSKYAKNRAFKLVCSFLLRFC